MPTIQKLKLNLTQSQKWNSSFKEEIKKLMEELTHKNEEISRICRGNIDLNDQIYKNQSQLKTLLDEKQRNGYKKDKLQIKVQELTSRIRVYEEGMNKKLEWNKQLRRKVKLLEKEIEGQDNLNAIDELFQGVSESKVSLSSFNSNSSSKKSYRSEILHPQIDLNLAKIKKLQTEYHETTSKCKQKEEQLERLKKTETRLREKAKELSKGEQQQNKQNNQLDSNSSAEMISKQTRKSITRLKQLEEKNNNLTKTIQSQRMWIKTYVKDIEALVDCESKAEPIRSELVQIQRHAKKQRKAMETLFSLVLKERNV